MDSDKEILLTFILKKKKNRKHRFWQHVITSTRVNTRQYNILFSMLEKDEAKFFDYFRMIINSFKKLLFILHIDIEQKDINMRKSISAEERLVITLR